MRPCDYADPTGLIAAHHKETSAEVGITRRSACPRLCRRRHNLGYTFRARLATGKRGEFVSFSPAVSDQAAKKIRQEIRRWRLHLRSASSLDDLAREVNPVVRGWIGYYGRFYRSRLARSLSRIEDYLVRWAMRKYNKLRYRRRKTISWLVNVRGRVPRLFAHWTLVAQRPVG